MKFSLSRALVIARREYLATVLRKAFLFTLVGMPAYMAFVMFMSIRPQMDERVSALESFKAVAVVDSSGEFANAPAEIVSEIDTDPLDQDDETRRFVTAVVRFETTDAALAALERNDVQQVVVIPRDFLASGAIRRYLGEGGIFKGAIDQRPIEQWVVDGLLAGRTEPERITRVFRPLREAQVYKRDNSGAWTHEDDRREIAGFFLPMMFAALLGVCIVTGGQYLLQGVSEEKESRILESMLCSVSPGDLMVGKLLGLGSAGLTLVGAWMAAGALFAAPAAAFATLSVAPSLLLFALLYFALGYLFYASLMTGIGAITNNMREAQQFAFMFTFANFAPFIMLMKILGKPNDPVAIGLSLFPPTASTTMMLRLASPDAAVPAWQIAASLGVLAAGAALAVVASAKLFRIGLLMYGKTPTLPEILKALRQP